MFKYVVYLQREDTSERISLDEVLNVYGIDTLSRLLKEKIVQVSDSNFLNLSTEFTS